MTTIATDGLTMAGDGLCIGEGLIHSETVVKVRRLPDGRIVGAAGTLYGLDLFAAWLENGGDRPELSDNFEALVLQRDGRCLTYNDKCQYAEQSCPAATGSGAAVAIGAMEAGASPEKAVEIASRRDTGTGGMITVIRLTTALAEVA